MNSPTISLGVADLGSLKWRVFTRVVCGLTGLGSFLLLVGSFSILWRAERESVWLWAALVFGAGLQVYAVFMGVRRLWGAGLYAKDMVMVEAGKRLSYGQITKVAAMDQFWIVVGTAEGLLVESFALLGQQSKPVLEQFRSLGLLQEILSSQDCKALQRYAVQQTILLVSAVLAWRIGFQTLQSWWLAFSDLWRGELILSSNAWLLWVLAMGLGAAISFGCCLPFRYGWMMQGSSWAMMLLVLVGEAEIWMGSRTDLIVKVCTEGFVALMGVLTVASLLQLEFNARVEDEAKLAAREAAKKKSNRRGG